MTHKAKNIYHLVLHRKFADFGIIRLNCVQLTDSVTFNLQNHQFHTVRLRGSYWLITCPAALPINTEGYVLNPVILIIAKLESSSIEHLPCSRFTLDFRHSPAR